MAQIKNFRDYEVNPIDINNSDDIIELINNIVGLKVKTGYFRRWSREALLSEGWIQIQSLKETWDPSKGVSFNQYCYMFLPSRISDGMQSFEEGMHRSTRNGTKNKKWIHRSCQFDDNPEREHQNPANGAYTEDTFAQHEETIVDRVLNHPSLTEAERTVVYMIGRGTTMKAVGAAMGVTESRISQRCKMIRSKINE